MTAHALPHIPQLLVSVMRFVHVPLQLSGVAPMQVPPVDELADVVVPLVVVIPPVVMPPVVVIPPVVTAPVIPPVPDAVAFAPPAPVAVPVDVVFPLVEHPNVVCANAATAAKVSHFRRLIGSSSRTARIARLERARSPRRD